ncbi:DUF2690 domain-containing protein [Ktedonobacter sp. SOSP1-52]|uniref:DUF2690 domain-containing protein n=1 Tax=Ktedonobacter sp. SOSP1-52 TaxID=2778366 RepID=UPI00191618F6
MFNIKRMISLGLMLLMLSTMLVFTTGVASAHTTSTAVAAASCYDTGCDGQNPISKGCVNDAQNIYIAPTSDLGGGLRATLYLRYSQTCRAAWAQIWFSPSMPSGQYGDAGIERNGDGKYYECNASGGNGWVAPGQTSCYSPMVGDAYPKTAFALGFHWTNGTWHEVVTTASY